MCAIAGLLANEPQLLPRIQEMARLQRHRGPDDEGYLVVGAEQVQAFAGKDTPEAAVRAEMPYRPGDEISEAPLPRDAWLALGHRRLSILDLSPLGHQPMSYQGRFWIVYNGEVYNYLELRSELETQGHRFISRTDTEVILAAYAEWGHQCFPRLNGMWALAIYDAHNRELVLSRSRFGVKPLYYWNSDNLFAFASEIKAFTCLPGWRAQINGQAVHDFLLSGLQDHSSETMFKGVLQLEPGCYARLLCGSRREAVGSDLPASSRRHLQPDIIPWYQLQPQPFAGSFADAAANFRERLTEAVRLRLRSDVPVGSCLSGGLDSSSIVCTTSQLLAKQEVRQAHKTFSACSDILRYDERRFIEPVVAATGVESHYVFPSHQELFADLDKVVWHQDEPFAGTSIYAPWCVLKSAAGAQIKVMLDGQGADEMLYGYADFRRAFLCGLLRSGHGLTAWKESRADRGHWQGALSAFARGVVDAATPVGIQQRFRQARRNRRPPEWLAPEALGATFPGRLAARFHSYRSAGEMSLELLTGAHLQMLLHWEDRNSMAHSIESRVPFLDFRLAEFTTGLPDQFKIRNGLTKAVMREAMKGLVPAAVLERRDKMGFVTPESVWATEIGADEFRRKLNESVALCGKMVTPAAAQFLEDTIARRRSYQPSLWRIICLGAWMRFFNVTAP